MSVARAYNIFNENRQLELMIIYNMLTGKCDAVGNKLFKEEEVTDIIYMYEKDRQYSYILI